MDVALDVLLDLAQTNVAMVAAYNVFIKGVLDYLDNLTLAQTRTLFDIFSILALKVSVDSPPTGMCINSLIAIGGWPLHQRLEPMDWYPNCFTQTARQPSYQV